jgi:hypothetical protein
MANPDVSGFNTSQVTNMGYMFSGATAWSTDNYNKAMLAWGKQNVTSGVSFNSYSRPIYTGLPETRKGLLEAQGWTITDSGNTTGTGYFGIAVSTDGGSTWTPVTENTVTLYDNTSAGVQYIATDGVDREVTVRAYYIDVWASSILKAQHDTENAIALIGVLLVVLVATAILGSLAGLITGVIDMQQTAAIVGVMVLVAVLAFVGLAVLSGISGALNI